MRLLFIGLAGLLLGIPTTHALPPPPAKHFRMDVKHKYGSRFFVLYHENKTQICRTHDNPYYEMKSDPLAAINWKALEQKPQTPVMNCLEPVAISDTNFTPPKRIRGCLSESRFKELLESVAAACSPKASALSTDH